MGTETFYLYEESHLLAEMKLVGSMLNFPTIVFAILLCCCQRIIHLCNTNGNAQTSLFVQTDAMYICTTPGQHIFTLPSPNSKRKAPAKALLTI